MNKIFKKDVADCDGVVKNIIAGTQIGSTTFVLDETGTDRKFKVTTSSGLAWPYVFYVEAQCAQDAVDSVIDFCEKNEFKNVSNLQEIMNENESENSDDVIMEKNLTCGGNAGLYVELLNVSEI